MSSNIKIITYGSLCESIYVKIMISYNTGDICHAIRHLQSANDAKYSNELCTVYQ